MRTHSFQLAAEGFNIKAETKASVPLPSTLSPEENVNRNPERKEEKRESQPSRGSFFRHLTTNHYVVIAID